MKLLVTGGAGYIGSNYIRQHLKTHPNDTVINFDKLTYAANLANLADIQHHQNYRFVQGDITDPKAVDQIMADIDIIVHFAAESHVDRSIDNPGVFVMTNVIGTQVLLNAALEHHIKRFHHISTDEVFGALELDTEDHFNEDTPYNPHSPYSASKAGSDHLVRAFHTTFGLPVTISNCSNNYGPYQYPEKVIPLFITNLIQDQKVPLYGDGLNVRDWLFVEDHCQAIDLILDQGKVGETYCIGGGHEISNKELTLEILKRMGKDESYIQPVADRPGHDRRYSIDASKIKRELGWSPEHDFDSALDLTIEWYRTHPDWWSPLKSS